MSKSLKGETIYAKTVTEIAMTMDSYCHVEDDTVKNEMALVAEMA